MTAELRFGRQIIASHNAVAAIMNELGIRGLPARRLPRGARVGNVTCGDLVRRAFRRDAPARSSQRAASQVTRPRTWRGVYAH